MQVFIKLTLQTWSEQSGSSGKNSRCKSTVSYFHLLFEVPSETSGKCGLCLNPVGLSQERSTLHYLNILSFSAYEIGKLQCGLL